MNKFKKTALLFTLVLCSCTDYIEIVEAKKTKHISGLPTGKNYIDYKIKITSKVDFSFKNLMIGDKKVSENLYIKDLSTGSSSTKIKTNLKKGVYEFGFRTFNLSSFNIEETIKLSYQIKEKDFMLEKKVFKEEKVNTNR
ncbi:MAG: hypothetical protein AB8B78_10905 [Polaribacter sp.]